MLESSGERIPPCGAPVSLARKLAVLTEDGGLQERLHQFQEALVPDPRAHPHVSSSVCAISSSFGLAAPVRIRATAGGTPRASSPPAPPAYGGRHAGLSWNFLRAGDRNRTGIMSLEGSGSDH